MKLPYGISHFETLRKESYFYADRTPYIERLENLGERYLMFLRPRRFGKSLFISTLEYYYGEEHQALFSDLFDQTYIGKNPTSGANTYKVLSFDFSGIETSTENQLLQGFLGSVSVGIKLFIQRYTDQSPESHEAILSQGSPAEMMKQFFNTFHNESIYLLVDEYDHFANELLAQSYEQFLQFVGRDGFVRKFYEVVKVATQKGSVKRLFITGVTPITMDSLTSGFNILKNLSVDNYFNGMMGFTRQETQELIQALSEENPEKKVAIAEVLEDLKRWYNGYRFHPSCEDLIYNPDMILHFATAFSRNGDYPDQMIDINVASDYGKIRKLFQIKNPDRNYEVLKKLIEEGRIQSKLTSQFSFEKDFEQQDFISLLFYLGFISIESSRLHLMSFVIPNHVIQRLYWDYFITLVRKRAELHFQTHELDEAIIELSQENRIEPFLQIIENALNALSNRDFMNFDEKYIKALFVGFVNLTDLYFIRSETEFEKHYPDILLLYRKPVMPNYQFIFELKYLKKSDAKQLEKKVSEAEKQLKGYLQSKEIRQIRSLKAWVIVFVGDRVGKAQEVSL